MSVLPCLDAMYSGVLPLPSILSFTLVLSLISLATLSILLLIIAVGIILRFISYLSSSFWGEEYGLRDIERAINLKNLDNFPLAGPEAISGKRLLGPFYYILLQIPLFMSEKAMIVPKEYTSGVVAMSVCLAALAAAAFSDKIKPKAA